MTRTEYNRAVDHFSDGVYRFILKMCKSKEMAEDVVQDSFMKLWEEVGHIAYDKAKSFLFSTAYHRMIDVLRRETKFGDIETVGYYESDMIRSAIRKDIIHSSVTLDTKQMGRYCVDALTEYQESGYANEYFAVDISLLDALTLGEGGAVDAQETD